MYLTTMLLSPGQEENSDPVHTNHQKHRCVLTSAMPSTTFCLSTCKMPFFAVRETCSSCQWPRVRGSSLLLKEGNWARGLAPLVLWVMFINLAAVKLEWFIGHLTLFSKKENNHPYLVNTAMLAPFIGLLHGRKIAFIMWLIPYKRHKMWVGWALFSRWGVTGG